MSLCSRGISLGGKKDMHETSLSTKHRVFPSGVEPPAESNTVLQVFKIARNPAHDWLELLFPAKDPQAHHRMPEGLVLHTQLAQNGTMARQAGERSYTKSSQLTPSIKNATKNRSQGEQEDQERQVREGRLKQASAQCPCIMVVTVNQEEAHSWRSDDSRWAYSHILEVHLGFT